MSLLYFIINATKEPFETTLFLSNRISLPEKRQSSITFNPNENIILIGSLPDA